MSTETRLREIGDELEQLFANDLRAEARPAQTATRRTGRWSWLATRRRRWLAVAGVLVVGAPGVAYATGAFTSPQTVARSLPAGARIFGSTPTCTTVRANVEYRCTLRTAPPPDPVQHLTARQWNTLLAKPPNLGKVTFVQRRQEVAPGKWRTVQFVKDPARLARITQAYRDKVLASFGFTPAQIKAHDEAIDAGAAGIGADHFKGTVEPTVNAGHHVNGGCRATSADGSRWECYIGHAAVRQKIVSQGFLGQYVPEPGVG